MIYLEMAGRLGNQMFRYSFARKLSLLSNKKLIIDFDRVYKKDSYKKQSGWDNSLNLFQSKKYFTEETGSKRENFFKQATIGQLYYYFYFKIVSKLLKNNRNRLQNFQMKIQPKMNKYNLYFLELGYYEYDLSHLNSTKVVYVCGCFECSKYFSDITDQIQSDFTPIKSIDNKNKKLYNNIMKSNSICVTVRRGDFVSNQANSRMYNICDKDYFDRAVEQMASIVKKPTFIIFSDDVEWAKNNIDFKGYPVYSEDGTDTLEEKLRLMSSCKHFIISNSTFSWWAQFLSTNSNKKVISPSIWYKNKLHSDLIEDKWIKIDVEKRKEK